MNDNPNPEDIKRAIKDARVRAGRAKMKGDTGDEEFNARKLKTLKQFTKESVLHPKVRSALDHAPDDLVLPAAKGAFRRLRGQRIDSGIKSSVSPKGSSRAVLNTREHDIVLDGKPAKVAGVLKMVYKGTRARVGGQRLGTLQNKAESSSLIQQHATMVQQPDGSWKTNPNGVVPPVIQRGTGDKYLHMAHARDATYEDVKRLTKSKAHPNGIDPWSLSDYFEYPRKEDLTNPVVKKFHEFSRATGVRDFHEDNIGVWTHPHTGKEHLVLRDAGFDPTIAKAYRDVSYEYKDIHFGDKEKLTKYTNLKKKRQQAKRFKKYVKEDWKRGALMGAAATAAGALTAKMIGFPVVAGAVIAGGHYALSKSGLRKDLRHKRKRVLNEKNWEKYWLKKALGKARKNSLAHEEGKKKWKKKNLKEWDSEKFKKITNAIKTGVKDKAALAMIAAPIPGSAPLGIAKMGFKAYQSYKNS